MSKDIIKPNLTDCTLSENLGYAISDGAKKITEYPEYLPFDLRTNGLEITTEEQDFTSGEDIDIEVVCKKCNQESEIPDWEYIDETEKFACPSCNEQYPINDLMGETVVYKSNLGFTFWNTSDFTKEFLDEFQQKLGTEIILINQRI
ncbi:MAG: hypothetical protein ACK58Q_04485 [Chitinophagales bacterium]